MKVSDTSRAISHWLPLAAAGAPNNYCQEMEAGDNRGKIPILESQDCE